MRSLLSAVVVIVVVVLVVAVIHLSCVFRFLFGFWLRSVKIMCVRLTLNIGLRLTTALRIILYSFRCLWSVELIVPIFYFFFIFRESFDYILDGDASARSLSLSFYIYIFSVWILVSVFVRYWLTVNTFMRNFVSFHCNEIPYAFMR